MIIFLIVTSYAVGTRLHELHQKSVSHHSKHKKKHKNHHEQPNVDPGEEIELDLGTDRVQNYTFGKI